MKTKTTARYKRFILFSYDNQEASGGFHDIIGSYDELKEAKDAARYANTFCHIFDCELRLIVSSNDNLMFKP